MSEGSVSAVSTSIAALNEDYVQAQARRIEIEAALKQAREMQQAGEELDALPQVASDGAVSAFNAQLAGLDVERGRLGEKFKPGHPEMQKVTAQIEQLQAAKANRAGADPRGAAGRVCAAPQARGRADGAPSTREKAQAASQSRKVTELEALRKEADSAKSLYEVLLQKLNETDIAASMRSTHGDDRGPGRAPRSTRCVPRSGEPRWPGCSWAFSAAWGSSWPGTSWRTPSATPRRSSATSTSTSWPRCRATTRSPSLSPPRPTRTCAPPSSSPSRDENGQVVLVTGTAPQEGKTTTIHNLAELMAGAGERTVVVDCDLRRAQMHQRLGLQREPGFTDVFVNHAPVATLLKPTSTENLFALTAGPLPPNPPALLARKALADLFAELRAGVRLGAGGLAPSRLGDRRAAPGPAGRPHGAGGAAQQGRQEAHQAERDGAAQGHPAPAGRGPQRGRRAGPQLPVLLLPAARRRDRGGRPRPLPRTRRRLRPRRERASPGTAALWPAWCGVSGRSLSRRPRGPRSRPPPRG